MMHLKHKFKSDFFQLKTLSSPLTIRMASENSPCPEDCYSPQPSNLRVSRNISYLYAFCQLTMFEINMFVIKIFILIFE